VVKQVIIFRRDLNMRKGKIAAQVAHASMKVFFDRGKIIDAGGWYEGTWRDQLPTLRVPLTLEMREWVEGLFTKIVLTVDSEDDLLRALILAQEAGLPTALITDAGKTEFHGVPTHTCIAIGPAQAEEIDKITGKEGVGVIPTRLP
jgi:peptidyl-tRNA hydrolase, PTH2 family